MIKVDWLAACIALRVVGAVLVVLPRRWSKICTILQPMGWLLTNKKQGNLDSVHAANIIKPTLTHINREKYTFSIIIIGAPKIFKMNPSPI